MYKVAEACTILKKSATIILNLRFGICLYILHEIFETIDDQKIWC